jgi:aryl-alcohol dehydrogenase-like predicted oxidoreductase
MEALVALKDQGKIRAIGASNVSPTELRAYAATGALDAIQEEYSMVERGIESTLLPMTATHGIATLSYSSLALGLLAGTTGPERTFAAGDQRHDNPRFSLANRIKVASFMETIGPLAAAHGATRAQIVIAWTLAQPGITFALCGARTPEQACENAGAGRIRLAADEVATITAAVHSHLTNLDA